MLLAASTESNANSASTKDNDGDDDDDDDDEIGPMPPQNNARLDEDEDDEAEEEEDSDNDFDSDVLPVSRQIKLSDHRRTVSALTLDPSGARLISGGRDCTVKLWDFHGMNETFRPFRSIDEPCGGNPIRDLQFSNSGDQFLIASGANQAKLYDREGKMLTEYMKGDMYLRDMKHTKGHISALTCCKWHPNDRSTFLTASLDSSIRIWNVENKRENKVVISVKSKDKGGRTAITAATYSPDGKLIAAIGQDGELRLWGADGPFLKPTHSIERAHMSNSVTSSIAISMDNFSMITRSNDDTLKLWDIRNFKKAVATVSNLPSFYEESNAIFSPNNKLVVTGISVKKDEGVGKLMFYDKSDLSLVKDVEVGNGSVVKVLWNGKINQICASTTDGAVHVFYDDNVSVAGAKFCAGKKAKTRGVDDMAFMEDESKRVIINPHALPMYREDNILTNRGGKRKLSKVRADPIASRKPDRPMTGPGRGGKVGTSLTNHIMKGMIKDTMRDEDPREAILKYADEASANPFWIAPAYKTTQPKAVMAEKVYEDEDEEDRANKKSRPK
ncbi:WD40-repeat-containing domain protein [Obelidium mucronatum]|nr:WD40-repeat-containing domain protein [Obelidium mucronatum]